MSSQLDKSSVIYELKCINVFRELAKDQLLELIDLMQVQSFSKNSVITEINQECEAALYLVLNGDVWLERAGMAPVKLPSGCSFGEELLAAAEDIDETNTTVESPYTVRTTSRSSLAVLTVEACRSVFDVDDTEKTGDANIAMKKKGAAAAAAKGKKKKSDNDAKKKKKTKEKKTKIKGTTSLEEEVGSPKKAPKKKVAKKKPKPKVMAPSIMDEKKSSSPTPEEKDTLAANDQDTVDSDEKSIDPSDDDAQPPEAVKELSPETLSSLPSATRDDDKNTAFEEAASSSVSSARKMFENLNSSTQSIDLATAAEKEPAVSTYTKSDQTSAFEQVASSSVSAARNAFETQNASAGSIDLATAAEQEPAVPFASPPRGNRTRATFEQTASSSVSSARNMFEKLSASTQSIDLQMAPEDEPVVFSSPIRNRRNNKVIGGEQTTPSSVHSARNVFEKLSTSTSSLLAPPMGSSMGLAPAPEHKPVEYSSPFRTSRVVFKANTPTTGGSARNMFQGIGAPTIDLDDGDTGTLSPSRRVRRASLEHISTFSSQQDAAAAAAAKDDKGALSKVSSARDVFENRTPSLVEKSGFAAPSSSSFLSGRNIAPESVIKSPRPGMSPRRLTSPRREVMAKDKVGSVSSARSLFESRNAGSKLDTEKASAGSARNVFASRTASARSVGALSPTRISIAGRDSNTGRTADEQAGTWRAKEATKAEDTPKATQLLSAGIAAVSTVGQADVKARSVTNGKTSSVDSARSLFEDKVRKKELQGEKQATKLSMAGSSLSTAVEKPIIAKNGDLPSGEVKTDILQSSAPVGIVKDFAPTDTEKSATKLEQFKPSIIQTEPFPRTRAPTETKDSIQDASATTDSSQSQVPLHVQGSNEAIDDQAQATAVFEKKSNMLKTHSQSPESVMDDGKAGSLSDEANEIEASATIHVEIKQPTNAPPSHQSAVSSVPLHKEVPSLSPKLQRKGADAEASTVANLEAKQPRDTSSSPGPGDAGRSAMLIGKAAMSPVPSHDRTPAMFPKSQAKATEFEASTVTDLETKEPTRTPLLVVSGDAAHSAKPTEKTALSPVPPRKGTPVVSPERQGMAPETEASIVSDRETKQPSEIVSVNPGDASLSAKPTENSALSPVPPQRKETTILSPKRKGKAALSPAKRKEKIGVSNVPSKDRSSRTPPRIVDKEISSFLSARKRFEPRVCELDGKQVLRPPKNVFQHPVKLPKDFNPPVYPKNKPEEEKIRNALSKRFVFQNLPKKTTTTLISAFKKKVVPAGKLIIEQDTVDDYFYVVSAGECQFEVDGEKVGIAKGGDSFGEDALVFLSPRDASVRTSTEAEVFRIDQKLFRRILQSEATADVANKRRILEKIEFLQGSTPETIRKLTNIMTPIEFEKGETLTKSSAFGDSFYVITKGEVECRDVKFGKRSRPNETLGPGESFGKHALVEDPFRKADVVAKTEGTAYKIDKDERDKVLSVANRVPIEARSFGAVKAFERKAFTPLRNDEIWKLSSLIKDVTFAKGETIIESDSEQEAAVYFIREGKVHTLNGRQLLVLTPGTHFGESIFDDAKERKQTTGLTPERATAEEDCVCGILRIRDYFEAFRMKFKDTALTLKPTEKCKDTGKMKKRTGGEKSGATASELQVKKKLRPVIPRENLDKKVCLGEGAFGQIWLCAEKKVSNPDPLVLKIMSKSHLVEEGEAEMCIREKNMMQDVSHPFVVDLLSTYNERAFVFMLMEFIQGGELFSVMNSDEGRIRLKEDHAKFYALVIADALAYLHQKTYVYRDLKPENVMIDSFGYPKLIDFGFAKKITDDTFTLCGTPGYLAPEVIASTGHNWAADHWSLGILIYEMVAGDSPFYYDDIEQFELFRSITEDPFPHIDKISSNAYLLISQLLEKDPTKRLGSLAHGEKDILKHPWFEGLSVAKLRDRQIKAPWKPNVDDPFDASNFDDWSDLEDKMLDSGPKLSKKDAALFDGF